MRTGELEYAKHDDWHARHLARSFGRGVNAADNWYL
jgi:hypothetical protein